jgi:hypothetical protein
MSKWNAALWIAYSTAAAGYGGWCGRDVWSGWGIWCFLIPAVAVVAFLAVRDWRRNPMGWTSVKIALLNGGIGIVGIGGGAMVVAWSIGSATAPWSSEPAVRALVGAGMWAAVALLVAIVWKPARSPSGGTP